MNELKQGTSLQGGKYIIKRVLGQGGFGITYLAEQVSLGREIAIKEFFMKDNCSRDESTSEVSIPTTGSAVQVEQYRKKFLKEARTLASLDHPHIVSVIDVWEENGTVYYSMPHMPGGSLRDYVINHGRMLEQKALRYVGQIASALKYMHEKKHLCHYDIKPANILIDSYDNAILIDFGISKNYDSNGNETSSTPVGMSEGFAPLEQYQQMVNEFSPASDVYALGATLYFMLTGKKPQTAISRTNGEEMYFPDEMSTSLREFIERTMTISLNSRPSDVQIFFDYISKCVFLGNPSIPKKSFDDETISSSGSEIVFIANNVSFKMVKVTGGMYMMGATDEQHKDAENKEKPVHTVTIQDFCIGKYEVTQELWVAIMGNNPCKHKDSPKYPVTDVNWNDCQEFIFRLNRITGKKFRLPTEAEWEFAARGGNKTKYYKFSGSNNIDSIAWHYSNRPIIKERGYGSKRHSGPQIVGQKSPNELGLYDMSGNVWEWCQDSYRSYGSFTNPFLKYKRILRGGCCNSWPKYCRVSCRYYESPSSSACPFIGFRLAMDA